MNASPSVRPARAKAAVSARGHRRRGGVPGAGRDVQDVGAGDADRPDQLDRGRLEQLRDGRVVAAGPDDRRVDRHPVHTPRRSDPAPVTRPTCSAIRATAGRATIVKWSASRSIVATGADDRSSTSCSGTRPARRAGCRPRREPPQQLRAARLTLVRVTEEDVPVGQRPGRRRGLLEPWHDGVRRRVGPRVTRHGPAAGRRVVLGREGPLPGLLDGDGDPAVDQHGGVGGDERHPLLVRRHLTAQPYVELVSHVALAVSRRWMGRPGCPPDRAACQVATGRAGRLTREKHAFIGIARRRRPGAKSRCRRVSGAMRPRRWPGRR